MIMYMWGSVFALGLTLILTGILTWDYFERKTMFRRGRGHIDAIELAKAAHDVKKGMLAVLLSWTWPVAVPVLVVYGLYRLYKSVDADSKNPTK